MEFVCAYIYVCTYLCVNIYRNCISTLPFFWSGSGVLGGVYAAGFAVNVSPPVWRKYRELNHFSVQGGAPELSVLWIFIFLLVSFLCVMNEDWKTSIEIAFPLTKQPMLSLFLAGQVAPHFCSPLGSFSFSLLEARWCWSGRVVSSTSACSLPVACLVRNEWLGSGITELLKHAGIFYKEDSDCHLFFDFSYDTYCNICITRNR